MSVIELTASYRLVDALMAHATIEADLEQMTADLAVELRENLEENDRIYLTLLHESFVGETRSHDFLQDFQLPLELHEGESLTVIARWRGRIVGTLVSEVVTDEESRLLLHPRGGYNVQLHQQRLRRKDGELVARRATEPLPSGSPT